jgi:low affinity Fe/Cu permease
MHDFFRSLANWTANAVGSPWAFIIAVTIVIIWGLLGPWFHFSDTWQLTINTTASIVPSLMVFLIQNTQNRDAKETPLKLDELLRAVQGARLSFISLEHLSEDELARLEDEFTQLRHRRPDWTLSDFADRPCVLTSLGYPKRK